MRGFDFIVSLANVGEDSYTQKKSRPLFNFLLVSGGYHIMRSSIANYKFLSGLVGRFETFLHLKSVNTSSKATLHRTWLTSVERGEVMTPKFPTARCTPEEALHLFTVLFYECKKGVSLYLSQFEASNCGDLFFCLIDGCM